MTYVRLVDGERRPIPKATRDVQGLVVDLSGSRWRLNDAVRGRVLNWGALDDCDISAVRALQIHLVRLIESSSASHVGNTFRDVGNYLRALRSKNAPSREVDLASLTWHLENLRKTATDYKFAYIRAWYRASADRLIDGFDADVVFTLDDLRIPGNKKGFAVLSADPEEGPLTEFEEATLRRALIRDNGPIQERAALWLMLAFGCNPANLSLLREEDFRAYRFDDGVQPAFFLDVPRIKKRMLPRSAFKRRSVDLPLAHVIEELINYNRERFPNDVVRPLFRARRGRRVMANGPLNEYVQHSTARDIAGLVSACVRRLHVKSPRTGEALKITPRRLRYTFATKMVRQGISERELAELLDHTDTQNVQVYYKADSRFVERLNAAVAEELGPRVNAFMGEVVKHERGMIDLIPYRDLPELGVCGASFACRLSPPKNCYTCPKFKAFDDGAHDAVLYALIDERNDYLESGFDRLAEQLDETILAVGEVVAKTKGSAA
jgi:integrase